MAKTPKTAHELYHQFNEAQKPKVYLAVKVTEHADHMDVELEDTLGAFASKERAEAAIETFKTQMIETDDEGVELKDFEDEYPFLSFYVREMDVQG